LLLLAKAGTGRQPTTASALTLLNKSRRFMSLSLFLES